MKNKLNPKILITILFMALFCMAESATAIPYSPSMDFMDNWVFVGASNNSGVPGGSVSQLEVAGENDVASLTIVPSALSGGPFLKISGEFEYAHDYWGRASVGLVADLNIDLTGLGYTSYELMVKNNDNSAWNFRLWMISNQGESTESVILGSMVTVDKNGSEAMLTLDLSLVNLADIDGMGLNIASHIPNWRNKEAPPREPDWTFEFNVSPAPEPSTLILIGSGLIGLLGFRRKFMKK